MIPLLASSTVIALAILIPLAGVVAFLLRAKKAKTTKFTLDLNAPAYASGEMVEGTVSLATGVELPATGLVVALVGIYDETRRRAHSTTGYDEDEDEWNTTEVEVFRHEEALEIPSPIPKKYKGSLPFSLPTPRPEQVTIRTPSGGIRQGTEIQVGELPGHAFATLNWEVIATLVGTEVEPETRLIEVALG